MNHRSFIVVPILFLLLLLLSCSNPMTSPNSAGDLSGARRVTLRETDSLGVRYEKGVLGPGALYEIWVPPAPVYNQCLVIYAHGYVNPSDPVALSDDTAAIRPLLLANGFAVAHSSYSQNGWAVKDGAIRIRQLREYFAGAYGPPAKAYLVGASEGAMISIMLAEKNPELFTGALCIGGPLGGAEMEVKYIYNIRILFDYFFADELGVVAGIAGLPPESVPHELLPLLPLAPLAEALQEALGGSPLAAHPTGSPLLSSEGMAFAQAVAPLLLALFQMSPPAAPEALWMATVLVGEAGQQRPLFNWPPEMLGTGNFFLELAATVAGGLWYNIYGTEDMLSRTHGHVPVDNTKLVYTVGLTGQPLTVEQLSSHPDAVNYLEHWYQPTGKLSIPVAILHTARDPIVPVTHAYAYQQLYAASGGSGPLDVDVIPYFGHCQILPPPNYIPTPATDLLFMGSVISDFNWLLGKTGMPPLLP